MVETNEIHNYDRSHLRKGLRRAGDRSLPGLSILILCRNELESLKASLETWESGGVLSNADEVPAKISSNVLGSPPLPCSLDVTVLALDRLLCTSKIAMK